MGDCGAKNQGQEHSKRKRKAFYRRCAAGEVRVKKRAEDEAQQEPIPVARKKANLEPGLRGFLATFVNNRQQEAYMELFRLLNEAKNTLAPNQEDLLAKNQDEDDDEDVLTALAKENKQEQQKKFDFTRVNSGAKNLLFVGNEHASLSCVDLINAVFDKALETGSACSRFLLRLLPVQGTCHADLDSIKRLVGQLWPEFLARDYKAGEARKYLAQFKSRNSNCSLNKVDVYNMIVTAVQENCPADPGAWTVSPVLPTVVISCNVIRNVACISFLQHNTRFAKYNLAELQEVDSSNKTMNKSLSSSP